MISPRLVGAKLEETAVSHSPTKTITMIRARIANASRTQTPRRSVWKSTLAAILIRNTDTSGRTLTNLSRDA